MSAGRCVLGSWWPAAVDVSSSCCFYSPPPACILHPCVHVSLPFTPIQTFLLQYSTSLEDSWTSVLWYILGTFVLAGKRWQLFFIIWKCSYQPNPSFWCSPLVFQQYVIVNFPLSWPKTTNEDNTSPPSMQSFHIWIVIWSNLHVVFNWILVSFTVCLTISYPPLFTLHYPFLAKTSRKSLRERGRETCCW